MKNETFAFEVKDMISGFISALGDIVIRRYDNDRNITDKLRVTMMYAPKQRVLFDIINKSKAIVLPAVSVYQAGMTRDPTRVFNKLDGSYYDTDLTGRDVAERLLQPVPVDLAVNVSIISRYQEDIDQIITNWAPYFDPYIIIEWRVPNFGHLIKTPVEWSGSVNMTYPVDIAAETPYRITADTSFTIKGWLFKAQPRGIQKIFRIDSTYTPIRDLPLGWIDVRTHPGSAYETDFMALSARPRLLGLDPVFLPTSSIDIPFTLYGDMFNTTVGVFLSGTNIFNGVSAINYFASNEALSAKFPAFSGVPVRDWDVLSDNKITFDSPSAINTGFADVIVVNAGGYGSLVRDTNNILLANPYPVGSFEYVNYISPVSPAASGIHVISVV